MVELDCSGTLRQVVYLSTMAIVLTGCNAQPRVPAPIISTSVEAFSNEPYAIAPVNRKRFAPAFWPAQVMSPYNEPAGTIVIDRQKRQLFLIERDGMARRYGVGVGGAGKSWSGRANVGRMAKWPSWYPTDEMHRETKGLPKQIEPGLHNPLGARALYLYQDGHDTLYRIHSTTEPWTIGTEASSGCFRMINEDVIDLFSRVQVGANVIVY